jgi:putative tryptophan/tyrosine transport system substrate-binding protein
MKRREFIKLGTVAAAIWPLAARAQQSPPVIGFLHQGPPEPPASMNAFPQGLLEGGIGEAQTIAIEDRAANGQYDRLPALAADLVSRQVTVIAAMFTMLGTKNLELLRERVPKPAVVGVLINPSNPNSEPQLKDLQAAARALGQELVVFRASTDQEIDNSFATLAQSHVEALVIGADGFLIGRQDRLVTLAARYAIPTIYPLSQYVLAGGLMSYGAKLSKAFRQTGIYVGRILKGAKPADLPVLQSARFELAINLKTAKALSLVVPPTLLALADEVIE